MSFHGMDRELKIYPSTYLEEMLKIMNIPSQGSMCLPRFYTESPKNRRQNRDPFNQLPRF
jgi:hypothetical protein